MPDDITELEKLEEKEINTFFHIFIGIKGVDSILEILGGIILFFVNPMRLNQVAVFLTEHELVEDSHDLVANYLVHVANTFSVSSKIFIMLYLFSHGIVKLFLIIALMKNKLWAYPASIFFFSVFIIYEMYRFFIGHSQLLILVIILDILVVLFIYLEYRKVKKALAVR